MKFFSLPLFILFSLGVSSQAIQNTAPWMKSNTLLNNPNITFNDIIEEADNYFLTIDKNKKGSGIKPFERWKYHWSFYTKEDGTLSTASDLWNSWEEKNNRNNSARAASDTSDWVSIGPNDSSNTYSADNLQSSGQGRINTIAVDPNNPSIIYVGAPSGGLWKSTDAGVNWIPLTDYLPQIGVSGIAIDPSNTNTIYITTGDDDASDSYAVGVLKSTDGGITWNSTGSMLGNPDSMNEIYIDPNNTNTLLVATKTGVFKTTNGGTTWERKLSGNIIDLKMKPGDASVWYAVSSSTFYKSSDSGETFSPITISSLNNSQRLMIDVTPADPNVIYMVSAGTGWGFNGVYKSTDSGDSFTKTQETSDIFQTSQAWFNLSITISDTNPQNVFVGTLDIWKTTTGGLFFIQLNQWYDPNTPDFTHADIHFMRFIDGKLYVGSDGGIYVSDDEGVNFTDLTKNLEISQFYKISVSHLDANTVVGGIQDNGGMALDQDKKWKNYHGGDGMEGNVDPTNPDTYYGFIQYGGRLYKSTNRGDSSTYINAPASETGPGDGGGRWVTPMAINSSGVVYAGYGQLYKVVDGDWVVVSTHFFGGDLSIVEIDPNNEDNIYVARGSNFYKSSDGGVTFSTLPLSYGTINSFEVSNNDSNIGWLVTSSKVYKTTDLLSANPTFSIVADASLPSEAKLVIKHHNNSGNNTVYLGTTLGVYYINDNITEWQIFDNNLPNVAVRDLDIHENDSKLYAGTYGRGVFVTNIQSVLGVDDPLLQKSISVSPNPSTDIFNLSWENGEKASIKVYNYIGQIVFEDSNISNNYPLNLSDFNRGLYFLRLTINGKQATKKILLK